MHEEIIRGPKTLVDRYILPGGKRVVVAGWKRPVKVAESP
jgi:hypothetical protein